MRQPMESRHVTISRARFTVEYPASFMLIASMNPCPCGYYNHPDIECQQQPCKAKSYMSRVSGPLLDRIDMHIEITPVEFDELSGQRSADTSANIRERVTAAREAQQSRFEQREDIFCNAMMPPQMVREVCTINNASQTLLKTAMHRLSLSARAYDRILKVARTIADLAGTEHINPEHVAEAIQYRNLDRETWGD
jgi:magnesium chelatase family protein